MSRPLRDIISDDLWTKFYTPSYTTLAPVEIKKHFKISICTNSMDRLYQLKETYVQNIKDNLDYPNIEFVLLNYNSQDDIDTWVMRELSEYMKKGIVHYYKTSGQQFYSMSHSRNVMFRLATGDIVYNIDADHFTTKGFAFKVNELANQLPGKIVIVKGRRRNRGRIGMFRSDFLALGGYDEDLIGYGFDDKDLLLRAYHAGFKILWTGSEYCRIIEGHKPHKGSRYRFSNWRYTQERNALISLLNIIRGRFIANEGINWGSAMVNKDFTHEEFDSGKLS